MADEYTLWTNRLILREIRAEDAELIVKWRSNPQVYQYFCNPHKLSIEEHLLWYYTEYLNSMDRVYWIALEPVSQSSVGIYGAQRLVDGVEINYLTAPISQNKGYARECVQKIMQWCTDYWDRQHVYAKVHKDNVKSVKFIMSMGFYKKKQYGNFIIFKSKKSERTR